MCSVTNDSVPPNVSTEIKPVVTNPATDGLAPNSTTLLLSSWPLLSTWFALVHPSQPAVYVFLKAGMSFAS